MMNVLCGHLSTPQATPTNLLALVCVKLSEKKAWTFGIWELNLKSQLTVQEARSRLTTCPEM